MKLLSIAKSNSHKETLPEIFSVCMYHATALQSNHFCLAEAAESTVVNFLFVAEDVTVG